LLQFCPNLKEFDIDATFSIERHDFEFQYIVDQALIHRDQMNRFWEPIYRSTKETTI